MTMNNSRLISNRIPLILENHDHVSLKINADASGWFARNDGFSVFAFLQQYAPKVILSAQGRICFTGAIPRTYRP
jgi:hypothetical protein